MTFALWVLMLLAPLAQAKPPPVASHQPLRVLFIGNSFTFAHDVPELIAEMAHSRGKRLYFETVVKGGQTLSGHWKDGRALAAIFAARWDVVVLQGHSFEPVSDPDEFLRFGKKFAGEIEKPTRLVVYETWPYHHELPEIERNPRKHAVYPQMAARLHQGYAALARATRAAVAPVGPAWQLFRQEHPDVELYARDGKHASPVGGYLAALVLYRALYGEFPAGMPTTLFPRYNKEDLEEFPPELHISDEVRAELEDAVRRTPE